MTSTDKNIVRAKQILDSWPDWKKSVQLTKYKPTKRIEAKSARQQVKQL